MLRCSTGHGLAVSASASSCAASGTGSARAAMASASRRTGVRGCMGPRGMVEKRSAALGYAALVREPPESGFIRIGRCGSGALGPGGEAVEERLDAVAEVQVRDVRGR